MGLIDTETVDSTANVIILLLIIVVILCAYILYKAYIWHNKCITKRALR